MHGKSHFNKTDYTPDLIERVIISHYNNLNKPKWIDQRSSQEFWNFNTLEKHHVFKKKVKDLTKTSYNQGGQRTIFLSKPLVKVQLENPIQDQNKKLYRSDFKAL